MTGRQSRYRPLTAWAFVFVMWGLTGPFLFETVTAQHKDPVEKRDPEWWRFYHAMEHEFAAAPPKKGARGPYRISEDQWREAFTRRGKYEDCDDAEYSRQVLFLWWGKYYADAYRAKDWETLARSAAGGRGGERDPET